MSTPARFAAACIVLGLLASATSAAAAEARDVVAQDLKQLRAPGKVEAAIWTRRADGYTLQVVLKYNGFAPFARDGDRIAVSRQEPEVPRLAQLQVWLLRADGTLIQPGRTRLPNPQTAAPRTIAMEVTYMFPESAGTEAVAVAMRVDGEFYIQKLESFGS